VKVRFLFLVLASVIGIAMTAIFYLHPPIHFRQLILLVLYIILHFWLVWRHRHLNLSPARMLTSVILAFAWLYSSHTQSIRHISFSHWFIFILAGLGLSLSFYLLTEELKQPFSNPAKKVSPWWMLLYGIIPIAGWTPYFLAYYPAKMNADSFWQWAQAHRVTPWDAWHPILHTWMIQLTTLVYNSPASYIVFQILIVSAVIAYSLYSFQNLGMPFWLVLVIDLFYALNPVNGFLTITMWKDIPFAASILLLTVLLTKIVADNNWLKKRTHVVSLIIVSFFAMNLRTNGLEAVLASLIIMIIIIKELRRRLLFIMIPILILQFIFSGPLMSYFNVVKAPLNEALAVPSQQIAATYKYHGKFTPELKAYFDQILPAKNWSKNYIPYNVNRIKWDPKYNANVIYASFPKYLSNWASLFRLNPNIFVRAYMKQMAVIWQFSTPKKVLPYLVSPSTLQHYPFHVVIRSPKPSWHQSRSDQIKANYSVYAQSLSSHGKKVPTFAEYQKRIKLTIDPLKTKPVSKKLKVTMDKLFNHTRHNWKNYFLKGAIPLFIMLLGLLASISRFKWRGLIVFLPAIFVILTMGMAMPATDFRYSYGFVLSVPFLFFYSKLRNRDLEDQTEQVEQ
jgi:hypothetical protein